MHAYTGHIIPDWDDAHWDGRKVVKNAIQLGHVALPHPHARQQVLLGLHGGCYRSAPRVHRCGTDVCSFQCAEGWGPG